METIYFTNLRKLDKFSIDWKLHAVNSHNSSGRCGDDGGRGQVLDNFLLTGTNFKRRGPCDFVIVNKCDNCG